MLLDAAGRDVILVETVGVGRMKSKSHGLAHVTLVVLTPGAGDDVQTLKAGIMEIAQVFVINKADLPGADKLEREIQMTLGLAHGPQPKSSRRSRSMATGVEDVLRQPDVLSLWRDEHSAEIWAGRLREMLRDRLLDKFSRVDFWQRAGKSRRTKRDPFSIVHEWLKPKN
jgi:LAO/AO transport system kinase